MACPTVGLSTGPTLPRFLYYKTLTLVPVTAAITAMVSHGQSMVWPFVYVGLCLTHAGIMNAAKCPHCPYYKMGDRTFACFIRWSAEAMGGSGGAAAGVPGEHRRGAVGGGPRSGSRPAV